MRGPLLVVCVRDKKTGVRYLARATQAWKQVRVYKTWADFDKNEHETKSASLLTVVPLPAGLPGTCVYFQGAAAFRAFLLRFAFQSHGHWHAQDLPGSDELTAYTNASLERAPQVLVAAMCALVGDTRALDAPRAYPYAELVATKPYAAWDPASYYATYAIVAEEGTLKIGMCKGGASIETRLSQYLVHVPVVRALVVVLVPATTPGADTWFKKQYEAQRLRSMAGSKTEWLGFARDGSMREAVEKYEAHVKLERHALWDKM